ncbi:hypothetical protein ACOSQ3_017675 [Xanthoceras sorbifolium]
MEEVAKGYMDELIDRSLIQVGKRYWGRIATCRVHDLLRDLAIDKAKNLNSLYIYDEIKHSNISSTISSCPRHAVYSTGKKSLWLKKSNPLLRSLSLFDNCQHLLPICKKFRRHFTLSSSSVLNLLRLQTLDLFGLDWLVELPVEICKLQEVRHLIGKFKNESLHIDSLTKLQTLKYIQHMYWNEIKTEKLVNLRELWIYYAEMWIYYAENEFSFDSMANLKSLQILSVEAGYSVTRFASVEIKGGDGETARKQQQLLPKLECLSLTASQLKDDPMPLLEKLPFLTILHLGEGFYSGKKIMCSAKGFLLLEILLFDEYNFEIEEWQVEEEALPRLRGLRILEVPNLTIPERLKSIPTPDPCEYTTVSPDEAVRQY